MAEKYYALFKDELKQKEYDLKLLDTYAAYFSSSQILYDVGCGLSDHIS